MVVGYTVSFERMGSFAVFFFWIYIEAVAEEYWALGKKSGTIKSYPDLEDAKAFSIEQST